MPEVLLQTKRAEASPLVSVKHAAGGGLASHGLESKANFVHGCLLWLRFSLVVR
jgi:hypothetical protein